MHKILIENRICLYLNHGELIESLYKQYITPDNRQCYSLKPELFNFKPKVIESTETVDKQITKRKRRKAETENDECLAESAIVQPFLNEIKNRGYHNQSQDLENMPRVWEDDNNGFPQFHGANNTIQFQTTNFQKRSYIIPPKCKFYNYNVEDMSRIMPELEKYDIIIMDMPWQNKYIKRLKRVKQSLAYQMLDNEHLKKMPLQQLIHSRSLVVIWCTNALQHQRAIKEEFLPMWNLKLVHTLKWYKLNTEGQLISPIKPDGYKQPYEFLFIACHQQRDIDDKLKVMLNTDFLASIPSIVHSHKPPLIAWLKEFLDDPDEFNGMEVFARYLQPQFTSIGLEVLKLMDERLYEVKP